MRRLLFLIVALIVYGCLYPWHFDFGTPKHPLAVLLDSWPPPWDIFALRDAAINVLLYLPFGAAALWVFERRYSRRASIVPVLLSAVALSASLEMMQVYVPSRTCSLFDVLCNLLGAAAGVAVALVYHPFPARRQPGQTTLPAGPLLLLAFFAGYELYPFFPVLSRNVLHHALDLLRAADGFSLSETACCAAEWFAAFLLIRTVLDCARGTPIGRIPPALAVFCLPLRLVIPARTEALHEVLGAALACLAWMALPGRVRLRAGLWLLALAILLRELAPFHFSSTPSSFTWIPFVPTFESERQSAVVILFRKAFDYGGLVWLAGEQGISYLRAGTAAAAALAALEALQRYLPGRTPETTDSVLVLLLTVTLWILNNFQRRRGLLYSREPG